ncbi:hypothetical protein Pst134EA_015365 [Puccinia striiformis f. sp. tritici]|uniref:hypothetical protein n=1 Tax=Puccinia striiformis f. sp. tritici TaxID=168172 RepID=UPI002007EB52|nr:hypothetical protein Pst134EA_015365 [Puccinia striiformis f. sp. tritici]KAH9463280.1 hypothetical protein Pst134EA_015365 [Puccinia striiformis f. sp. tritici]
MRKRERARRKSKSELEIANALDARLAANPLASISSETIIKLAGRYGTSAVLGGAYVFAYKASNVCQPALMVRHSCGNRHGPLDLGATDSVIIDVRRKHERHAYPKKRESAILYPRSTKHLATGSSKAERGRQTEPVISDFFIPISSSFPAMNRSPIPCGCM